MEKVSKNKKIVMIIAFKDFQDQEYLVPKKIFQEAGIEIVTASNSLGEAIGSQGNEAKIDILIKDINISDYNAVLFIGGYGAQKYIEDKVCHQVIRTTIENKKILGAICIAPAILAKAGVLKNKKATIWNSALDKSAIKILENNGAFFQPDAVVAEDKIITANGPYAAEEFAKTITKIINE
jgi:protease I